MLGAGAGLRQSPPFRPFCAEVALDWRHASSYKRRAVAALGMTDSQVPENWVDLVGFRFEHVHTGVLKWLLKSRDHGSHVAACFGIPEPDGLLSVHQERSAPGGKKPADLVAAFEGESGELGHLVVETKVDSPLRPGQIQNLTSSSDSGPCSHRLLALGAEDLRLFGLTPGKLGLSDEWPIVGARTWLKCLEGLDVLRRW
jgi:hypothetical protein